MRPDRLEIPPGTPFGCWTVRHEVDPRQGLDVFGRPLRMRRFAVTCSCGHQGDRDMANLRRNPMHCNACRNGSRAHPRKAAP